MSQRQVYTVGSSLLAKAKVKALQLNLLPPQQQQPFKQLPFQQLPLQLQQQQHQNGLDPLTKLELHKRSQEEGADGRRSSSDGTDVESNASNSNSNTISVGTSNHLKSIHNQHNPHHHSSSAQLDNIIMSDSDPQPDNSHDPSNDSDSTVTDHHPHEELLSPPNPRSRRCSTRSRNSIGPDDEKMSSACIAAAAARGGGATTTALLIPAVPHSLSIEKEIAAGVEAKDEEEENIVVVSAKEKADMIGEVALPLSDSPEPTMLMTTQDSAALYEAIFQRQHLTEDAIAGSLHELRQLILAYGIPEQVQYDTKKKTHTALVSFFLYSFNNLGNSCNELLSSPYFFLYFPLGLVVSIVFGAYHPFHLTQCKVLDLISVRVHVSEGYSLPYSFSLLVIVVVIVCIVCIVCIFFGLVSSLPGLSTEGPVHVFLHFFFFSFRLSLRVLPPITVYFFMYGWT